jgi:CheY-like chemotaxis protein
VLIVDDNKINLLVAQKQIERNFPNIQISLANDGKEALEAVQLKNFDLILMDMQMPVMNGVEATLQIRQLTDTKKAGIPIVAMTANAGQAEIKACMDAGMNDTLIKPFALSSLISLLNLYLYTHGVIDFEI